MGAPKDGDASLEQIEAEIRALTDVQCLSLERFARYQVFRYPDINPKEVFNEAIGRALEGRRAWPLRLTFQAYLCGVIRSVADECRAEAADAITLPDPELPAPAGLPRNPVESEAIDRDIARSIWNLFKDREDVKTLIVARELGLTAKETQEQFDLTEQQYDAARKHLERTIVKHYPDGYKS